MTPTPSGHPDCPVCRGTGITRGPYYSNFKPSIVDRPCPSCRPITEVSIPWTVFAMVCVIVSGLALIKLIVETFGG